MDNRTSSGGSWEAADRAAQEAIDSRAFPGAVLLAGQGKRILFHRAYGQADIFGRIPMSCETIFDLASLTKPLATTLVAMYLSERGMLEIDRPVSDFLPEGLQGDARRITPRMLLAHTSGLAAWRPYFQALRRVPPFHRKAVLRKMLSTEPVGHLPGTWTLYSDVGFMLLYCLLELLFDGSMPDMLKNNIYPSMGVDGLFFPNASMIAPDHFAAGQLCPWRSRLLKGEVDDENAFALGGAAGHAGLFGTALAVHRLVAALWGSYAGENTLAAFSSRTVKQFLRPPTGGARALGFDVPSGDLPGCGRRFSGPTIGHLGFTGVSVWLELETGTHIVMLTNRTHPHRFATGIKIARSRIHDALMAAARHMAHDPPGGGADAGTM